MRHSIRKQFSMVFIMVLLVTILMTIAMNILFLRTFLVQLKQRDIINAYLQINRISSDNSLLSENFQDEILELCERYSISIIIMNHDSQILASVRGEDETIKEELVDYFLYDNPNADIVDVTEQYVLQVAVDEQNQNTYLELWGTLDNGYRFLIRSPMENLENSASVSNQFWLFAASISALAGGIMIIYVTNRITRPIRQLTEISERMTNLDFDAKYEVKGDNEVDRLGMHMNQMSNKLEHTISELKTANNELKKDIEKKEQIDEMRKEFLANVSHELKTPIALIQGYAEGLKMGINDNDEASKEFYCDVIMDEANKMNDMVKKLMSLNELEFGNNPVQMERFDISELIHNYLQSMELLFQQNDIKVECDIPKPVYVWADEIQIEEVFRNYITNAMNHADGEKLIRVTLEKNEENVRISVFNTGKNIPEDSVEHIWDKFYKVDKARTREYGGSGVGLSIVKAVMEGINQKYGVRNEEDGVTFYFEVSC
ncbi:MAG: HAMP domain-containing protein [Lachnospiraceae bacterium]|nr:HAMP domain-containing protein [Lachnospiraceae bacterium]